MQNWVSILPRRRRGRLLHCTLRTSRCRGYFPLTQAHGHSLNLGKEKKKILSKAPGELYLFCMALIQYIQLEKTATLPLPVLRK